MSIAEYSNAVRLGKKYQQDAAAKEKSPFLPVLDELLKDVDIISEVMLGTITIPLDQVIGTKTAGRTPAFSGNFMPLLDEQTEFCAKWCNVYNRYEKCNNSGI